MIKIVEIEKSRNEEWIAVHTKEKYDSLSKRQTVYMCMETWIVNLMFYSHDKFSVFHDFRFSCQKLDLIIIFLLLFLYFALFHYSALKQSNA